MYRVLFVIMTLFFCACTLQHKREAEEFENAEFFSLKTPASLLDIQKELKLSELADSVWYVPLETHDSILLGDLSGEGRIRYAGNKFYIYDGQQNVVHLFSEDGKYLNPIAQRGQGHDEFFHLLDFTTIGDTVYVCDFGNKIHRYLSDGVYLDKILLPKQAYRLVNYSDDTLACYITDNQFTHTEEAYSWLIVNTERDSIMIAKTPQIRDPNQENENLNYFVHHDFSTKHSVTYKEAFNDSLYYFSPDGEIVSYGYIDLGIHKISPTKTFEEMVSQKHAMRFKEIFDIPNHLIGECRCFCIKDERTWFVWDKRTGDFFQLKDSEGRQHITNDLGGPNFKPFACVYPNLLIGIAEAADCPDEFASRYAIKMDDNPILIMIKLAKD